MALIKCPECGHTVSDKAVKCPNCGSPLGQRIQPNTSGRYSSIPNAPQQVINSQSQYQQQVPQPSRYVQQPPLHQPQYEEEGGDKTGYYVLMAIAVIFYIIGTLDFCLGNFAKIDFTGVWWSPIAFALIGSMFEYFAKKAKS